MDQNTENINQDYQHGYNSGFEGSERSAYEAFLENDVQKEWLGNQLEHKREALSENKKLLAEVAEKHKTAYDKLQQESTVHSTTLAIKEELEKSINDIDAQTETLKESRRDKGPTYSLVAGIIFLAAGISFIAGDLIISHEIVAYALNIRNTNEAWAFAIGLAMVSVLLKPAYDRLIEEPYHNEDTVKAKSRYARFKLILSVFSIVTLIVLGWFRYEAYRTDKLKEAINKSVKNLQLNAVDPLTGMPISSPELTNKIEEALKNSDQLNLDLVNSPWALLSFVLSGVLFAIAGAVSLGMALPVLQAFWYRWLQVDPKLWRLRRRKKRVLKQMEPLNKAIYASISQKNICENDLSMLTSLENLRNEESTLKSEIEALENELKTALANTRIHSYADGYGQGQVSRNFITGEEYELLRSKHLTIPNLANRAKNNSSSDRAIPKSQNTVSGMRPHQAIRKAITDRFEGNNS